MNKQARNHLIALLQGMEENALSEAQAHELSALLESSQAARQLYIDYQFQAMSLDLYAHATELSPQNIANGNWPGWMDKASSGTAEALAELARLHEEGLKQPIDLELHRKQRAQQVADQQGNARRFSTKVIAIGSLAAAIALAGLTVLIVNLFTSPEQDIAEQLDDAIIVATLTDAHDAVWETQDGDEIDLPINTPMTPGQHLTLTEGFAEITTNRGAIAVIEAPATIELIESPNAMRLHTGKLVGICETESSKGFLVRTPHMDITDLGTRFGVDVRPDRIETSVFVGEIEVKAEGEASKRIPHSQTARLDLSDRGQALVVEDRISDSYTRAMPRPPVVTAARINLEGHRVEVVPQGVQEDVLRYTDIDSELNGITPNGLPAALLGGDLIRMPNLARPKFSPAARSLVLEVDLTQPADIYLVLHEAEPVHDWIRENYTQTTMRVGLDQAIPHFGQSLDAGAGNSIDALGSVWKFKGPAQGTVVIGHSTIENMYSIIVQPHQPETTADD